MCLNHLDFSLWWTTLCDSVNVTPSLRQSYCKANIYLALEIVEEDNAALTLAERRKPVSEVIRDTHCYAMILWAPHWTMLGGYLEQKHCLLLKNERQGKKKLNQHVLSHVIRKGWLNTSACEIYLICLLWCGKYHDQKQLGGMKSLLCLTLPGHSQPLREVRTRTQGRN